MIIRIFLFLLVILVTFLVRDHPFFWDTIQLGSKHAHYFFETGFRSIILPEVIDSGHPPAFGMYLAAMWKIFGKSLPVSHFAMLPFLLGIVWFLLKIAEQTAAKRFAPWLVLICFADPVLAGQSVLVSPDIVLVCFFLMALYAILSAGHTWLLVLSIVGLGLVSMRGMALGVGLFFFYWMIDKERISVSSFIRHLLPFIPGGLLALAFMLYHYQQTGWIGYHESSTWAPSFERVDAKGFLKNLAVLSWRMLDFGRIFYWCILAIAAVFVFRKNKTLLFRHNRTGWQLAVLVLITFIAIVINQLPYKGLLAHRYLLPVFLSLNIFIFHLLFGELEDFPAFANVRNVLAGFLIAGFLTGNLWVYPKKISQGWDSTLAHLPWYGLQEAAEDFVEDTGLSYSQTGTAFPNIGSREIIELNGEGEGFVPKDFTSNCYIFYSNVMNDFTDEEIDLLETDWREVFRADKGGVCIIIYQNLDREVCEN